MKKLLLLSIVLFGLLLCAGCCSTDCCGCKSGKDTKACAEDSCDKKCCGKDSCKEGTCSKKASCCGSCAGKTGWCEETGKGYYEGKEVKCKGQCAANPGGPPCKNCVK